MSEPRRTWAAGAVALALVGILVNVWRPLAPAPGVDAVALETFSPTLLATVEAYRQPRLVVALVRLAIDVVVPVGLLLWPATRTRIGSWSRVRWHRVRPAAIEPVGGAIVAGGILLVTRLVALPVAVWVDHVREVEWGFRTAGLRAWFGDWAIITTTEVLVAALGGAIFVVVWRRWTADWHWRFVVLGTALSALVVLLYPLLAQPLLLSTSPLPDGPMRTRLEAVVAASGIEADLTVGDASRRTTKVNAFVSGLGPSRQVVLWDTLLERPVDEVVAVVAHELAHRDHRDVPRGVALSAAGLLPFALVLRRLLGSPRVTEPLGVRQVGDRRAVALLVAAAAVAQVVALPPALWVSRRAEASADQRALNLTGDVAPIVAALRGFVVRDLSWPDPPLVATVFFGTHPSVDRRIRALVEQAEDRGLVVPEFAELEAGESAEHHARVPSAQGGTK